MILSIGFITRMEEHHGYPGFTKTSGGERQNTGARFIGLKSQENTVQH
jgi:hypothetical protein